MKKLKGVSVKICFLIGLLFITLIYQCNNTYAEQVVKKDNENSIYYYYTDFKDIVMRNSR